MTEKEHLVEILNKASLSQRVNANLLADYLQRHGVMAPIINTGDVVYHVFPAQGVKHCKVRRLQLGDYGWMFADRYGVHHFSNIGNTVFLTEDEANKVMKEREQI